MEYERSIFRVHQKIMTGNKCGSVILCVSMLFLAMGFVNFFVLFAGHIAYRNGTGAIAEALKQYKEEHTKNKDYYPSLFTYPRYRFRPNSNSSSTSEPNELLSNNHPNNTTGE